MRLSTNDNLQLLWISEEEHLRNPPNCFLEIVHKFWSIQCWALDSCFGTLYYSYFYFTCWLQTLIHVPVHSRYLPSPRYVFKRQMGFGSLKTPINLSKQRTGIAEMSWKVIFKRSTISVRQPALFQPIVSSQADVLTSFPLSSGALFCSQDLTFRIYHVSSPVL